MKVLITSVPAGSGHVRAAEALLAAFQRTTPEIETRHIQMTDFVAAGFRRLYVDGYRVTVNRAPALWGHLYNYLDQQPTQSGVTPIIHQAQRLCSTGFYDYLDQYQPDLILTTHFLVPQLLAAKPKQTFRPVVETVITDYDVHRFWVSDTVSHYYVAHEDMRETLVRYGVPSARISATGIPVHPCFSETESPSVSIRDLALNPERPVLLVLAGGFGMRQIKDAVQKLFQVQGKIQIITVSGKNELLRQELGDLKPPSHVRLINLGYVQNMHELLTVSDLVITKPGGLTVSECLAKKKMMILFSPIPGQEVNNARFLTKHNAAVLAKTINDLPALAKKLLHERPVQGALLWNIEHCARPHAAYAIVQSIARSAIMAA